MNIIYNVCKDYGNQLDFKTYANGIVHCSRCGSIQIIHNVEVKKGVEK